MRRHKSLAQNTTQALMDSISKFESDVIAKKTKSKELNKMGNKSFLKKKYLDAENFYSQAIELNPGSRPIRTNRAECRIAMKKYEEAISDCNSALSIDPKCTRSIIQKGNALLHLKRFDEAKECYELLSSLGKDSSSYLKKLDDAQDRIFTVGQTNSKMSLFDRFQIPFKISNN